MKMTSQQSRIGIGLALTLSAAALSGCVVDNQLDFVISQFDGLALGKCVADPGITTTLNSGVLDVGISAQSYGGYYAAPIVSNNLFVNGSATMVETNSVQLTGVEVTLKPTKGTLLDAAIAKNQRKFFVPAAGGLVLPMSKAGIVVEVIPTALAIQLASSVQPPPAIPERLIVHIEPVGKHAGQNINGGGVDFPIDICKFCLTTPPVACPDGGFNAADVNLGSCFPEQDSKVTCCISATAGTVCGADVPIKKST